MRTQNPTDNGGKCASAADCAQSKSIQSPLLLYSTLSNGHVHSSNQANISPDQLLSSIGARNCFVLYVWFAMAFVWAVGALPTMVSAFLMDDYCIKEAAGNAWANGTGRCMPQKGTITAEFHLNAGNKFLADLTTSAYIAGMAFGSLGMPFIADRKGRRPVLMASLLVSGVVGIASAFSPNIFAFIAMRFIQGTALSVLVNWVLAYESCPLELRSQTALIFGLQWVLGYCLVAPMAYLLPDWRQLIAAASAPSILCFIIYSFTIPESFHFLASKRNIGALREWIERANKWAECSDSRKIGKNELNAFLNQLMSTSNGKEEKATHQQQGERPWRKGTNWRLVSYLLVFVYLWTCDAFIYYALSLFSTKLVGDRYWNFAWSALVEVPSYLFAPVLLDKIGRRPFTASMHLLAALALFLAGAISEQSQCFVLLWLLAKFAISSSFTGLFVYSSEVFPTTHRNFCMGICSTVSQGISIFAPTTRLLANWSPIAPMLFFGCFSLFATMLTFLLPETSGKELPERKISER